MNRASRLAWAQPAIPTRVDGPTHGILHWNISHQSPNDVTITSGGLKMVFLGRKSWIAAKARVRGELQSTSLGVNMNRKQ